MAHMGSGPPFGEAEQAYNVLTVGGVETQLVATQDASRAKDRWLQGFTMQGDADLRYIRVDGPPATFQGQSWHFLGKRDHSNQSVRIDLPMQVFLPFDEDFNIFAFADGAVNVRVSAIWTYQKLPTKPQGFFYSQLINETIVGSLAVQDLTQQKTVAMALGQQTLMGLQFVGEGQHVSRMNVRSSLWGTVLEDEFEGDDGPWCPGADENIQDDGITIPLGSWKLADSRAYVPSIVAPVSGDIWAVLYWQTENVPPRAQA